MHAHSYLDSWTSHMHAHSYLDSWTSHMHAHSYLDSWTSHMHAHSYLDSWTSHMHAHSYLDSWTSHMHAHSYLDSWTSHMHAHTTTGIQPKGIMKPTTPVAFFDGKKFFLRLGTNSIINKLKLIWRYGFGLIRLFWAARKIIKRFCSIYALQENGQSFTSVPNMMKAIGGEEFLALTQTTAIDYFIRNNIVKSPAYLVDEIVYSCTNAVSDNDREMCALPTMMCLACVQKEERFTLVGGTRQLAEKALQASGATFHLASAETVTRVMKRDKLTYRLQYRDLTQRDGGVESANFDVVIIAHPLNASKIEFLEFPDTIYTPVNKSPYHRTVVTIVKGELNPKMFGLQTYGNDFPVDIFTPNSRACPVNITSLSMLPLSVHVADSPENKEKYYNPICEQPMRVWRIQSRQCLTREDKEKLFCSVKEEKVVDFVAAWPEYNIIPKQLPSFVLDDGMFYINAIEMATSVMESSAIGAKNVSLLAKEYLMASQNFASNESVM